jgi:hypothetical protein
MNIMNNPLQYFLVHWRGDHGFGWSFWVNLVAIRAALAVAQSLVFGDWSEADTAIAAPIALAMILVNIAIFLWQVVGVLRASDNWLRGRGSISNTWGAQLGILLAAMLVVADSWGLWILTVPIEDIAAQSRALTDENATFYKISVEDDGSSIRYIGEFRPGSTKALAALLMANPNAQTVVISSEGGNIFEARGVSKLIKNAGLDTQARGICSSACTIAFIGGVSRTLEGDTLLGFHQYRIEPRFGAVLVKPREEEARDRDLYRQAGIQEWFLERMYETRTDSIWFPSIAELRKSGVITAQ